MIQGDNFLFQVTLWKTAHGDHNFGTVFPHGFSTFFLVALPQVSHRVGVAGVASAKNPMAPGIGFRSMIDTRDLMQGLTLVNLRYMGSMIIHTFPYRVDLSMMTPYNRLLHTCPLSHGVVQATLIGTTWSSQHFLT